MRLAVIAIMVAIALAAGAQVALAQPSPNEGTTPEWQGHREHHRWAGHHRHGHACSERAARLSGRLAYLEVKLDLTADQRPLWDKWRQAAIDGAIKVRDVCMERPPTADSRPTVVDRAAHLQKLLATEASAMEAAQPALAAVYQSLNEEQRDIFERGMAPRHWHHHGPRHGSGHGAPSHD